MKISVVIPLYNKEIYIRRTIESVLHQNVSPDEIIIVDDGSNDGSANVVKSMSDSRIRLIKQQNAGECASRNRGVAEAKNDLVAFLDADDEWKPDFLTHIQRLVHNFPDCGAYATFYEVIESDGSIQYWPLSEVPPAPWIGIIPNLFRMMPVTNPFFPSSIAISKKVYQSLGGFPAGINRGGDSMMWIRLGVKYPIAYSPSRQVIYHRDAENRACVIFPSGKEDVCANLIEEMIENREIPNDLINDIKDYYAYILISKAQEMVKEGHMKLARSLLDKAGKKHKNLGDWFLWYFCSLAPFPLISFIVRIRSR